jgi:hypothetical protein
MLFLGKDIVLSACAASALMTGFLALNYASKETRTEFFILPSIITSSVFLTVSLTRTAPKQSRSTASALAGMSLALFDFILVYLCALTLKHNSFTYFLLSLVLTMVVCDFLNYRSGTEAYLIGFASLFLFYPLLGLCFLEKNGVPVQPCSNNVTIYLTSFPVLEIPIILFFIRVRLSNVVARREHLSSASFFNPLFLLTMGLAMAVLSPSTLSAELKGAAEALAPFLLSQVCFALSGILMMTSEDVNMVTMFPHIVFISIGFFLLSLDHRYNWIVYTGILEQILHESYIAVSVIILPLLLYNIFFFARKVTPEISELSVMSILI